MSTMQHVRLAIVDYANTYPLAWGFRTGRFPGAEPVYCTPAQCARLLEAGEVAAGLIPSITYHRIPGLHVVDGLGIAADGPARSVCCFTRGDLSAARRIWVDAASRTSVALLKLLLAEAGNHQAELIATDRPLAALEETGDAALVIGDQALGADPAGLRVIDLGAAWTAATGLPFVFALWAVREAALPPAALAWFQASYRHGLADWDRMAAAARERAGVSAPVIRAYLGTNIRYELGPREWRGLRTFFERAAAGGLLDHREPIRVLAPQETAARSAAHRAGD